MSDEPQYPPQYQPQSRRRRLGVKALVIAVVLAVLIGGGAFAFYRVDPFHLFRAGPQAAEALPAGAVFYAGIDLDPSAQQKINAVEFLNHFPAFKASAHLDSGSSSDIRKSVISQAIDSLHCAGVSYAADVAPWLGDKFGVAGMPSGRPGSPDIVGAIEVNDRAAATKGFDKLRACGAGGQASTAGRAFVGDYLIVAKTQPLAVRYARAADQASLADNAAFDADMSSLGDLGIATIWVNSKAAADAFSGGRVSPDQANLLTSNSSRVAATFRFASDHVEVAASVYGTTPDVIHGENQVVHLPGSTVMAVSEAGGGARVAAAWDRLRKTIDASGGNFDSRVADFESRTGFSLPQDLETILGKNIMFSVDRAGLTAQALDHNPSALNLGVRFTNDPAALNAIYDKVLSLMRRQAGSDVPFTKKDFSDGIVVASNDTYADRLGSLGGDLGSSDAFTSVVSGGAGKEFVFFFDWDAIEAQILHALSASGDVSPAVIANLRPLQALGVTQETVGHYNVVTFRLSVDH